MSNSGLRLLHPSRFISILLMFVLLPLAACSRFDAQDRAVLEAKEKTFEHLQGNLSLPISARIQEIPPDLLKKIRDYDSSIGMTQAVRYAAKNPTEAERGLVGSYIDLLPARYRQVFSQKLLAVYFIDDFSGAAITDWVVDSDGNRYYYMVLNSALLKMSLDDWLSYRANSFFDNPAGSPRMRVRTNTDFKAIMYAMLHEGAHVIDMEAGVTPYLDPLQRKLSSHRREVSEFTEGIWLQQKQPVARYDFEHRKELNAYAAIPGKKLIPRSELPAMFAQLQQTPFVSFYGATSWNEDFADYMAYRLIERKLGGKITLDLLDEHDRMIGEYAPLGTLKRKIGGLELD